MLVVLYIVPVAAPGKAMFDKEPVAQVFLCNFVGKAQVSVGIGQGRGGGDLFGAILRVGNVRIVQGIDVNSQAIGVL